MYVFDLDNFMEALQSAQRAEGSGSGLMRMRFALYWPQIQMNASVCKLHNQHSLFQRFQSRNVLFAD